MNSYSLSISGNIWLLVISIIIGIGLAFYTYRKTAPPVSNFRRTLLITLRSIALSILIFAIFEPIATMVRSAFVKPKIAVLLDNSISAGLKDAKIDRKKAYQNALNNSNILSYDDDQKIMSFFGKSTELRTNITFDSLDFSEEMTDISQALRWVSDNQEKENIQAAVLITDGTFNSGNNPIYDAEKFGKPIYTIGIGDTTKPRDISIESVITNEIAYIENPVPINVNIAASGFEEATIEIKLTDNGKEFAKEEFQIHPDKEKYSTFFEYMPEIEGNHKITAIVKPLDNEITTKNNTFSEYIKVLKNKRKVAIFAGSPSADLGFIKNELLKEKGVEIKEYVQKNLGELYYAPNESELNESEIIVMIGFPVKSTQQNIINMVKNELERGKPAIFIASNNLDMRKLKSLEPYLPFSTATARPQEFLAIPFVKPEFIANPLLRITGADSDIEKWNNLPPIFRTEMFVKPNAGAEVAAEFKVNNTHIQEPLLMTRNFQNHKTVAILGYGLFRWKMLGYAAEIPKGRTETEDLFSILISNAVRWISVNDKTKKIIVKTNKNRYVSGEKVIFEGQVYDASYTPIDDANVSVNLKGSNDDGREIMLSSLGNGRYTAVVEGLTQGDYSYKAKVTSKNREIGSDDGRFSIGELNIEYRNLTMNSQLLQNIAFTSGGQFYLPDDSDGIISQIESLKSFKSKGITKKEEFVLWDRPWLLLIAIFLFSLEWLIRKRSGLI